MGHREFLFFFFYCRGMHLTHTPTLKAKSALYCSSLPLNTDNMCNIPPQPMERFRHRLDSDKAAVSFALNPKKIHSTAEPPSHTS